MIVGIDEVGRGAWAGPMAVGAVLLGGASIAGLTDSKKLTKKQRELLDVEIRQKAVAIGIGWASAKEIDAIGLSAALKLASRRALAHIRHDYHEIIIDGTVALIDDPRVTLMKKADLLVPSVSAASIVAKVARDNYMKHLDGVFPGYTFIGHVGYGTAAHRAAIETLGVTPLHRLSFSPLQKYALLSSPSPLSPSQSHSMGGFASPWRSARPDGGIPSEKQKEEVRHLRSESTAALVSSDTTTPIRNNLQPELEATSGPDFKPGAKPVEERSGGGSELENMPEFLSLPVRSSARGRSELEDGKRQIKQTTKQIGDLAETETANYLQRLGHEIIARNWRTKFCEIDIVSMLGDTIYFTEVKYRKSDAQGGGLAAITAKKQQKMAFAAEYYAAKNKVANNELRLAAADVTGTPPQVVEFLTLA